MGGSQVRWHPLRETLGTRIVGMAAFTAEHVGDDVVEPHDESNGGRGHEEIYLVLRGRARFRLDGEELDAPSEWIERARPHLRSDPGRARAILDDLRRSKPESVGVAIAEALWEASRGHPDVARERLETALTADASIRTALEQDTDLGPLLKKNR